MTQLDTSAMTATLPGMPGVPIGFDGALSSDGRSVIGNVNDADRMKAVGLKVQQGKEEQLRMARRPAAYSAHTSQQRMAREGIPLHRRTTRAGGFGFNAYAHLKDVAQKHTPATTVAEAQKAMPTEAAAVPSSKAIALPGEVVEGQRRKAPIERAVAEIGLKLAETAIDPVSATIHTVAGALTPAFGSKSPAMRPAHAAALSAKSMGLHALKSKVTPDAAPKIGGPAPRRRPEMDTQLAMIQQRRMQHKMQLALG